MNCDVAIVGGGAAGLACAVTLSKINAKLNITVIDAGERLGKKLAATGNGQGNITNKNMSPDFYFSSDCELVKSIALSQEALQIDQQLFHCILTSDECGRVYPNGRQASALVDSLIYDLTAGGVNVIKGCKVTDIFDNFVILLSSGEKISAKFVVLCVGGKAQKQFKTDGSSYALAQKFGHKLTKLYPSLVQLKTDTQHIKGLKGIRTDCVVTAFSGKKAIKSVQGDVIFTDYGVSGNAIFSISPYIADKEGVSLSINFLPYDTEKVVCDIENKKKAGYAESELLSGTLHNQLGRAIIRRTDGTARSICNMAQHFTLDVVGTLGYDYAQVTKGGIDLSGITKELESKFKPNLFFAGEVLDVDGCCGGYNLHWAFSSGVVVAKAIAKRV